MIQWRIYYVGGATYDSDDGAPEDAPGAGVLVIVQRDDAVGRELLHGGQHPPRDFYPWERGRWWICDHYGFFEYLTRPGFRKVCFGSNIENEIFNATLRRAIDDPDFPPKSARLPTEAPV